MVAISLDAWLAEDDGPYAREATSCSDEYDQRDESPCEVQEPASPEREREEVIPPVSTADLEEFIGNVKTELGGVLDELYTIAELATVPSPDAVDILAFQPPAIAGYKRSAASPPGVGRERGRHACASSPDPKGPKGIAKRAKGVNKGDGEVRFFCKHPGCGKGYASTDAVRKHCRQRHLEWLRRLGHGTPHLYMRTEPREQASDDDESATD